MVSIKLIKHDHQYADDINRLSQAFEVKNALGLPKQSVEDTMRFNQRVLAEEQLGKTVSRLILNENGQLIGVTTLMYIDQIKKAVMLGAGLDMNIGGRDTIYCRK